MDIQRAKEIINSRSLINVHYHGVPVFIQQVHEEDRTATVFPLNEMAHQQVVDIEGLYEEGPIH